MRLSSSHTSAPEKPFSAATALLDSTALATTVGSAPAAMSIAPADARFSKQQMAKTVGYAKPTTQVASGAADATEAAIIKSVDAHMPTSMELLKQAVEVNSGTFNAEGVAAIADMYEPRLKKLGFATRRADMSSVGRSQHLIAELHGGTGPRFLLIGHMDTVFEPTSPFQHWEVLPNGMVHGPGAADMKGGNEVILAALEALHEAGVLSQMNITVIFSGDEESPGLDEDGSVTTTRRDLIEAAKTSDVALSFEVAQNNINTVKTARRGFSSWAVETAAKPAHSSQVFNPTVGPGAIYPLSQMLTRFRTELRDDPAVTVNIGSIAGGARLEKGTAGSDSTTVFGKDNIVPGASRATGDLRFLTPEEQQQTRAKMQAIVDDEIAKARLGLSPEAAKALQAKLIFHEAYPGMPETPANLELLAAYSRVSSDLGFGTCQRIDPRRAGAADISFTAPYTRALLDGLGAQGAGAHTTDEVLDPTSLHIAMKRLAVLMHRMTQPAR